MSSRSRLSLAIDLTLTTAILLIAAVPLFSKTNHAREISDQARAATTEWLTPTPQWVRLVERSGIAIVASCLVWVGIRRFWIKADETDNPSPLKLLSLRADRLLWCAGAMTVFLTYAAFYQPLQREFWTGTDDAYFLDPTLITPWNVHWEITLGRPMCFWASALLRAIYPDRIEGYLYMAGLLCAANSLLLLLLLRRLMPEQRFIWCAAPLLYIVQTVDPHRFYILWATNFYWSGLFVFLLALWLFIRSFDVGSRWQLVLACVCLGVSLLTTEAGFPLAAFAPLLLLTRQRQPWRMPVWMWGWLGTVGLLAAHFAAHLLDAREASYQWSASKHSLTNPLTLLSNFAGMLASIVYYFKLPRLDGAGHAVTAYLILFSSQAVVWLAWRRGTPELRTTYLRIAAIASCALVLAVLAYVPIGGLFRTLLYGAPAQAVLVACVVGFLASLFSLKARAPIAAVCIAALVLAGAEENRTHQDIVPSNRFIDAVRVFDQIHALSPQFTPGTRVVLIPDGDIGNLHQALPATVEAVFMLSVSSMNTMIHLFPKDDPIRHAHFVPDGFELKTPWREDHVTYRELVAFRLSRDGTVTLLNKLPAGLLPEKNEADRYEPLAHMVPGSPSPLPYLRYPSGADQPRDLFDTDQGLMLGQGWDTALFRCTGHNRWEVSRWVAEDAELAVNPLGKTRRQIRLEIESGPWFRGRPWQLQILSDSGELISSATVVGRQDVTLDLPLTTEKITVLKFHATVPPDTALKDAPRERLYRVVRTLDPELAYRLPPQRQSDIMHDGLAAGDNWQQIKLEGAGCFRVANDDARIDLAMTSPFANTLHMDLQPVGDRPWLPCHITAVTESGEYLASTWVFGRQIFSITLPKKRCRESAVRLRTDDERSDSGQSEADPRGFVRVYSCTCGQ